jgi:transposase
MTITIGIDPHKGSHTAVAIDSNEHVLDEIRIRSCSTQTVRRREWADRFEERCATSSCVSSARVGLGEVAEERPNDARSIAIAALRADDLTTVCADDHAQVLKLLSKRHRDLGRLKNKASCRLHALLLEMVPGGAGFRITTVNRINAVIDELEPTDAMGRQRQDIARELAGDIDRYNDLLDSSKQRIQTAVAASGTSLTTISGIGPITAAMIIGQAGNIDRFKSKHHFASYNATAPVEASSGSKVRHRPNQRGAQFSR